MTFGWPIFGSTEAYLPKGFSRDNTVYPALHLERWMLLPETPFDAASRAGQKVEHGLSRPNKRAPTTLNTTCAALTSHAL